MRNDILIGELKSLMNSEGWKYLTSVLEAECDVLTNSILEINPDYNVVNLTGGDLMKSQRKQLLELLEKPQELINQLSPAETIEMDS